MGTRLFIALILVFMIAGCSKKVDPPSLNSPVKMGNIENCRDASLDLSTLSPKATRATLKCLSGENKALAPYEDFLNSTPDADLVVLFKAYNKYLGSDPKRIPQVLTLLEKMRENGDMDRFYKNLRVMASHGVLQALLPVLARVTDPLKTAALRKFTVETIHRGETLGVLTALDDVAYNPNAHALALAMSEPGDSLASMGSDKVMETVSSVLVRMIKDGSNHGLLVGLSDVELARAVNLLTNEEAHGLASMYGYLADSSQGSNRLGRMAGMIRDGDAPLYCYNRTRFHPNLIDMVVAENAQQIDNPNKFFLQTLTVLDGFSKEPCEYTPATLDGMKVLFEAAMAGHAPALSTVMNLMPLSNRQQALKAVMKSEHLADFGPLVEELNRRHGLHIAMDLLRSNITLRDSESLGRLTARLATADLNPEDFEAWLTSHKETENGQAALRYMKSHATKSLWALETALYNDGTERDTLRDLKLAEASHAFEGSAEFQSQELLISLLTDGLSDLKALARVMVETFSDKDGGLSEFISLARRMTALSMDHPVQDFTVDLLNDDQLLGEFGPVLLKLSKDEKFKKALTFTGQIAGNGELDKLVRFLSDAVRSRKKSNDIIVTKAVEPRAQRINPVTVVERAKSYKIPEPIAKYQYCTNIDSIFNASGLYNLAYCANISDGNQAPVAPILMTVAEDLKSHALMAPLASVLRDNLVQNPYIGGSLNQVELFWRNRDLARLLDFLKVAQEKYQLHTELEPLLNLALRHPGSDDLLRLNGKLFGLSDLARAGVVALDMFDQKPKKTFVSNNGWRLQVAHPDIVQEKIRDLHKDWSDQQVTDEYLRLKEDFETHNDAWYFQDQVLPRLTDVQKRDKIINHIMRLLWTGETVRAWTGESLPPCKVKRTNNKSGESRELADLENIGEQEFTQEDTSFSDEVVQASVDESTGKLVCFQRSSGIENLVAAFQDIASDTIHGGPLDVLPFLRWGATTQRQDKWYSERVQGPVIRIQTMLDQLDLQLVVANVPVPTTKNAGIKFKLAVAGSGNLPKTVHTGLVNMQRLLKGADDIERFKHLFHRKSPFKTVPFHQDDILIHVLNMLTNYHVLSDTSDNGYMKISQRLMQAFRDATPSRYRNAHDPLNNDLGNMDRLSEVGLFSHLSVAVNYMDTQACSIGGQAVNCLDAMARAFMGLQARVRHDDLPVLREFLERTILVRDSQGRPLLQYVIDRLFSVAQEGEKFQNLKDVMFHLALMLNRMNTDVTAALKALSILTQHPKTFEALIDKFLEDALDPDGNLLSLNANSLSLQQMDFDALRSVTNLVLSKGAGESSYALEGITGMLADIYDSQSEKVTALWNHFTNYRKDPEVQAMAPSAFFKRTLSQYSGYNGFGDGLAFVLAKPENRAALRAVGAELSVTGNLSKLMDELLKTYKDHRMDDGLGFVFEHLRKTGTR